MAGDINMKESDLIKLAQEITGRSDSGEALEVTLRSYLEQKIKDYRQDIQVFSDKYGMDFREFKEKLGKEIELTWEHEQDFMLWEEAVTNERHFRRLLNQLKTKTHA